jgi:hypothetical protein
MENQELDVVEGSAPTEEEREIVYEVRAELVGALVTPGVMAPTVGREMEGEREREREREKRRKLWMIVLKEREQSL